MAGLRAAGGSRLDVLIVVATPLEGEAVAARLAGAPPSSVLGMPLTWGTHGGRRCGLLVTGVGKANAALRTGLCVTRRRPGLVLSVGVGGAFPGAGLGPGDLAVATGEVYGDEGVETEQGFCALEGLELPWPGRPADAARNRFPVCGEAATLLCEAGGGEGRVGSGEFVTVSTVTGSAAAARELERRWGALVCESMEGCAVAHAAAACGVAFAEVRGISNQVGPRDRGAWRLQEAAAAAGTAALGFVERWAVAGAE